MIDNSLNILDYMELSEDKVKEVDQTVINVIDNDLLYILSVLEKIDKVVGKTFGPYAGYVARETRNKMNVSNIKYTKDGLTTISGLNFMNPTDLIIANAVSEMVLSIKNKSGDGSTTAIRMLYNMIKKAVIDMRYNLSEDLAYTFRINTPKVINIILKMIKDYIDGHKEIVTNYEDIRNIAYISLNNDDILIKPIDKLIEYMKEKNIEIDKDFKIFSSVSDIDEVKLITRPGYKLSAPKFMIDEDVHELEDIKLIFLHEVFDMSMQIPLQELHSFAQNNAFKNQNGEPQKIIYVVSEIEQPMVDLIKKYRNVMYEQNGNEKLRYDFIEIDSLHRYYKAKREDLSKMLNVDEIHIQDYIEKRKSVPEFIDEHGNVIKGDKFDNPNNTNMWKMKMYPIEKIIGKNENGEDIKAIERDHETSRRDLHKVLSIQVEKAVPVNVLYVSGDDSLSVTLAKDLNEDQQRRLNEHIEKIKKLATTEDKDKATEANIRLDNMNSKYYLIEIPLAGADQERLSTAYRDACMAINSSVKYGYHMGGSIGIFFAAIKVESHFNQLLTLEKRKDPEHILDLLCEYLISIIRESYSKLIKSLLPKHFPGTKEAVIEGYIDPLTYTFGDTKVISPVETDIETIKQALELFSSFYSSLSIEFIDPNSALHANNVAERIKERLDKRDNISTEPIIPQTEIEEEEEVVVEETEEEMQIRLQFEQYEKEQEERRKSMLPLGMSSNIQPVYDPYTKHVDKSDIVKKEIEKYSPKKISDNLIIEGYAGDPRNLGKDIEIAREQRERKIQEINQMLLKRINIT